MAQRKTSYAIEFLFDSADGTKEAKNMAKAVEMLDKDVEQLRKNEKLWEKVQGDINKQLKSGNISGKEHAQLLKGAAQQYRKVTGDGSKYQDILRKEREELKRVNEQLSRRERLNRSVGRAMGAAGIAAGAIGGAAYAVGAMANERMGEQRRLRTESALTGVALQDFATFDKAVQQLTGGLGNASDALSDTSERISEGLVEPTSDAAEGFKRMGVDLQAIKGLSADKQFEAISRSLALVVNQGDRLQMARQALGDSAGDLAVAMADNYDRFEDLRASAEKLGLVMSEADFQKGVETQQELSAATTLLKNEAGDTAVQLANLALEFKVFDKASAFIRRLGGQLKFFTEGTPDPVSLVSGYSDKSGSGILRSSRDGSGLGSLQHSKALARSQGGSDVSAKYRAARGTTIELLGEQLSGEALAAAYQAEQDYWAQWNEKSKSSDSPFGDFPTEAAGSSDNKAAGSTSSMETNAAIRIMKLIEDAGKKSRGLDKHLGEGRSFREAQQLMRINERSDAMIDKLTQQFEKGNSGFTQDQLAKAIRVIDSDRSKKIGLVEDAAFRRQHNMGLQARLDFAGEKEAARLKANDDRLREEEEALSNRSQKPSLAGQNAFKGGSVEEFKFVSKMQSESIAQDQLNELKMLREEAKQRAEDIKATAEEEKEALKTALEKSNELLEVIGGKIGMTGF